MREAATRNRGLFALWIAVLTLISPPTLAAAQSTHESALIQLLHSNTAEARARAAELLRGARSDEARDALVIAVRDPDAGVRAAAAMSLGTMGGAAAVAALAGALRDPDLHVRAAAAAAISTMRHRHR